jgi:hypothetical protein
MQQEVLNLVMETETGINAGTFQEYDYTAKMLNVNGNK